MLLCLLLQDLCGFQHITFTQPGMSWHQSLDPVPEMARVILQMAQQPIRSRHASRPVTWGDVKNLTAKAQAVLQQQLVEQIPENLCAAIFAVLTANSLAIICLCLIVNICPLATAAVIPPKQSFEQRMKQNLWVQLANITQNDVFCLSEMYDMENLLSTCLVLVCTPSAVIQNFTGLSRILFNGNFNYKAISSWGVTAYYPPPDAIALHTPVVAIPANITCAKIVNCTSSSKKPHCHRINSPVLNCTAFEETSFHFGHVWLPQRWFFTCGQKTFNYIPANISEAQCCLSRLFPVLLSKQQVHSNRSRCGVTLDSTCDSETALLNKAEYVVLAVSLVGVPGLAVHAHLNINAIACNLAKTINATSSAMSAINHELQDLRKAILQNHAAIDYLLLHQHLGCESFEGMCCFNISDNSRTIQHQINILHNLASDLKIDTLGSWWESLWAWLPTGLLGNILRYSVITCAILIGGCCFVQCIPSFCNICIRAFSPKSSPTLPQGQVYALYKQLQGCSSPDYDPFTNPSYDDVSSNKTKKSEM